MWVLLRLLTSLVVGLLRFFKRRTTVSETRHTDGIAWVYTQATHKRQIVATTFGVPFAHPLFFRLSHEDRFDRFFKAMGLAREFQTGDDTFDQRIYVSCDHPAIEPLLQDRVTREALAKLFDRETKRIFTDGAHLWVHRPGDALPERSEIELLESIRVALSAIPPRSFAALHDVFFWKALVVESIAWSLALYGLPAIVEMAWRPEPLYLDWTPVILMGLLTAGIIFAMLLGLSWTLLRGSSRAHRVFTESVLVLAIGVPLSSIELVSDINIAFDTSAPRLISAEVHSKYTTVSRSRRGGRRTRYHVRLQPGTHDAAVLPAKINVSSATYSRAREGGKINFTVRRGALNVTWIAEIKPLP